MEIAEEAFGETIDVLHARCKELVEKKNRFKADLEEREEQLQEQWANFVQLRRSRHDRLVDNLKFLAYVRETDELQAWIKEQRQVAASDDYGSDFEHCEELSDAFRTFVEEDLAVGQDRVTKNNTAAQKLQSERNRNAGEAKEKNAEVRKDFALLREACKNRKEALHGALKVHAFDRDCDDLLEWMEQKESAANNKDYGESLRDTQEQINKHAGLQRDLAAIGKQVRTGRGGAWLRMLTTVISGAASSAQVEKLFAASEKLCSTYPDAAEHVAERKKDVNQAWSDLKETAEARRERLQAAVDMYKYLDNYREFMAWIADIMSRLMADNLATDVSPFVILIKCENVR